MIVLGNLSTFDPGELTNRVADLYLEGLFPQPKPQPPVATPALANRVVLAPQVFAAYVGDYGVEKSKNVVIQVRQKGDQFFAKPSRQPQIEIFPLSETKFIGLTGTDEIEFHRGADGCTSRVTLQRGTARYEGVRVIPYVLPAEERAAYCGEYYSDELNAAVAKILHAQEEAIRLFQKALELLASVPESPARAGQELELNTALGACLVASRGYPSSGHDVRRHVRRGGRARGPARVAGVCGAAKLLHATLALACACGVRPTVVAAATPEFNAIEFVVLHRLFREFYFSSEHFEGEEPSLGDALGADCIIQRVVTVAGGRMVRAFRGDGSRNEDWFGWDAEVLAPFNAVVERVLINPKTNLPGQFGSAPASCIVFLRNDGMRVMFAHVQSVRVAVGDRVKAGQVVAQVGNNGFGSCPHIHVGAWKDNQPFQIRWDLRSGKTRHP